MTRIALLVCAAAAPASAGEKPFDVSRCMKHLDANLARLKRLGGGGKHREAVAAARKSLGAARDSLLRTRQILAERRAAGKGWDYDALGEPVPARVYVILMAGFARGLKMKNDETAAVAHRQAMELARFTLKPAERQPAAMDSPINTPAALDESYAEAADLARYCLRLQGLPDRRWLRKKR